MLDFIKLFFMIVFYSDLPFLDIFQLLNIVAFSLLYQDSEQNREILSEKLSSLGVVIIKLGQWLAYFLEIKFENIEFMQLFVNTLPLLQTHCKKEKNINIDLLLEPYKNHVKSYEKEIYASASIGQIYKGKNHEDEDIVIKIKHENLDKDISKWESFFYKLFPFLGIHVDLQSFFSSLRNQLDFKHEANNMKIFYKKYRKNELVKIPKYFSGDENIIIMEYVPSISFKEYKESSNTEDLDYFIMLSRILYQDNVFIQDIVHLDLHSGNYGLQVESKSVVLYDFGWVLQDQLDFKKFFILCHIDGKKPLEYFLQKYELDYHQGLSDYVKELIEKREIDILQGLKVVIKLFPKNIVLDEFMFCVLSVCIFASSLMDKLQTDLDSYLKKEIIFIDSHKEKNAFPSLGAILKYSVEHSETQTGFLSKWYQDLFDNHKKLSSITNTTEIIRKKKKLNEKDVFPLS